MQYSNEGGKRERKNPSREACESAIQRILFTEIASKGSNTHFKKANDFMPYFESLYAPSPALTKQVQRAIHHLNLPKNDDGYFVIGKTQMQIETEHVLKEMLKDSSMSIHNSADLSVIFIPILQEKIDYTSRKLLQNPYLSKLIVTLVNTLNGILIYTENPEEVCLYLNELGVLSDNSSLD